ncbi:MAG TPA: CRISPR-associated endonuclease Cas1 [Patescibacteria group bacterium]|nr:CRISPR-associated endonuclease Cas1 [Patescibacteria group bacterium]
MIPNDSRPSKAEDPLLISLVAHHVFCPRRAWIEAAGEVTDSYQVASGSALHGPTDDPATGRPTNLRSVDVVHEELGIVGRCDTVEVGPGGELTVIEYKATPVRREPEVTEPLRMQLALQVEALRASGYTVAGQVAYFVNHRLRVPVDLSDGDLAAARAAVASTRATLDSVDAPEPLEDDRRCESCSHAAVCLPEERAEAPVQRRIVVADPDSQVVHLTTPGSRASIRDGRILVHARGEEIASIPIGRAQGIVVHGNVDLSGALIRELLWRSLTVVWCTGTGRVVGWCVPGSGPNGAARVRQHLASAGGRLDLAREFVGAKIANQATLLRRNGDAVDAVTVMRVLQRRAIAARTTTELLGIEGEAAANYFGAFRTMLSARSIALGFDFRIRSGRPARDPVNAALNYTYGIMLGDVIRAVAACGLDPHAGFLHSASRNKPALALDLCEELRVPVADSVVLGAINNGELTPGDFSSVLGTTRLRENGRRVLIAAYERRVQSRFRHPVFDYQVTWRRAMEVQARMVLGVLDGSQARYAGIRVR